MKKPYLVYIFQGYHLKTEDGTLVDNVEVQLIDTSSDKALARAKKLVNKEFWRLSMIVEKYQ